MLRTVYPHINENIERALSLIRELEELAAEVVVAGGAAVGLLITDPANPTVRPTQDLDVIVEEIQSADIEIKEYLVSEFKKALSEDDFLESISGHLFPDEGSQGRQPVIINRLNKIASGAGNAL